MTLRPFNFLSATGAVALAATLGWGPTARAADVPAAPLPAAMPAGDPCPTCAAAGAASPAPGCTSCAKGRAGFGHRPCKPYVTHLCPGACFGYFQTQWHRWEDVCPIPYQGVGLTDAPPRPTPPLTAPRPGGEPKAVPADPKADPKTKGSDAPLPKPAPVPPGTTPAPMPMAPMPMAPAVTPMPTAPGGLPPLPMPGKF